MLGALMEWGYQPSEVERLLLGQEPTSSTENSDADAEDSDTSAA